MDRLFDIMNSRNPFGKGFKAPLRPANKHIWPPFLNVAYEYLQNLQTAEGVFLYKTKRKTPILGYLLMIDAVKSLFQDLNEKKNASFKYILTYKFSQDYLELFFSAVRALNGRNNNPTFKQFKAAYRRLLNLHDNAIVSGNCTAQDNTVILPANAEVCDNDQETSVSRKYDFSQTMLETPDHDYCMYSPSDCYSTFTATIVTYIAGFVVKKVIEAIECKICANALYATTPPDYDKRFILIKLRDNGGLTYPSKDVLKIAELTERVFRRYTASCNGRPTNRKNTKQIVLTGVLTHTSNTSLFENLQEHMFDTEITDNHIHIKSHSICFYRLITVSLT